MRTAAPHRLGDYFLGLVGGDNLTVGIHFSEVLPQRFRNFVPSLIRSRLMRHGVPSCCYRLWYRGVGLPSPGLTL